MRALFVGGTGLISSAVSPLVVEAGHSLTLVTRGTSRKAAAPAGASTLAVDAYDAPVLREAIAADVAKNGRYDTVVQWIGFDPSHVREDIETFGGVTDQYVFISSASAYETPPSRPVVTENTPLNNPHWRYSRDKATSERLLRDAGEATGFPFTIVRPSHTYGYSDIPFAVSSWTHPWTIVDRMRRGRRFIVPGDGSSLWTLTDHRDFAVGLLGLLGNPAAIGEDFHITGDDVLTWNQIHAIVAKAAGIPADAFAGLAVHIPSDLLARFDAEAFEGPLLGDKTNAGLFDTTKLRSVVPEFATHHLFADAINESIAWFSADASRRTIDEDANALWDRVIDAYLAGVETMFR